MPTARNMAHLVPKNLPGQGAEAWVAVPASRAGQECGRAVPDEDGCVEQRRHGCDIDAHQHLVVNVLQPDVAVLHLPVGLIIVKDQLHLQQAWESPGMVTPCPAHPKLFWGSLGGPIPR